MSVDDIRSWYKLVSEKMPIRVFLQPVHQKTVDMLKVAGCLWVEWDIEIPSKALVRWTG